MPKRKSAVRIAGSRRRPTRGPAHGRFYAVGAAAAGTTLTVLVTWLVTTVISSLQQATRNPADISWSVETDPAKVGAFDDLPIGVVLPAQARPADGPGGGCNNFATWARRNGAIDGPDSRIQVAVQGESDGQVLISQARAVIVERMPMLDGYPLDCPTAGEAQVRALSVDLSGANLGLKYDNPGHRFGFTVTNGETETFQISAHAAGARFRWVLEVTLVASGRSRTVRIDDHGQPFETTGRPTGANTWEWDYQGSWMGGNGETVPAGGLFH